MGIQKARHTPGPWFVTTDFIGVWSDKAGQVACLDSEGSPNIDYDESLANAYLMAKAPEMLAILRQIAACNCSASIANGMLVLEDGTSYDLNKIIKEEN